MRLLPAALIGVASSFVLVLSLGFWIHDRYPRTPDTLFGAAAAVSIVVISFAIVYFLCDIPEWRSAVRRAMRPRYVPPSNQLTPEARAAEIKRRADLSARQLAYAQDPNATASCAHLQPIERAMRKAGIEVRRRGDWEYLPIVEAACRINEPELRRVFGLAPTIYYKEGYEPERCATDNPRADIICGECVYSDRARADLAVLHPEETRADTPWFPSAPV